MNDLVDHAALVLGSSRAPEAKGDEADSLVMSEGPIVAAGLFKEEGDVAAKAVPKRRESPRGPENAAVALEGKLHGEDPPAALLPVFSARSERPGPAPVAAVDGVWEETAIAWRERGRLT